MNCLTARFPRFALLPLLLLLTPVVAAQGQDTKLPPSAVERIEKALSVPEGSEIKVWAQSPMFYNPTSINVDERGRIWVAEAVNYRGFNNRHQMDLWHEKGDRIMILEDTDGDGEADSSKVFVQDQDLTSPLGVAVIGNKVIVSCSPNLIIYTRDADDNIVDKQILLTGWGGFDHDHSLHKLEAGPDGRWYFNTGNAGPHIVTDKSGWTLRAGSWYTGGSPYNTDNTPGLVSDDGRVYTGGVALSILPDGRGMRVIGHGFRNPYGTCTDSFGEVWMNDNDDTQSCRTTYLMRYGDLGYNSKDGSRSWQADRRPGQSVRAAHWRQDDPGVIPSGHVYGNGAPTGIHYYENGALGAEFDGGLLLSCESGQNVIWGYRRIPDGAGYKLEGIPFVTSTGVQDEDYVWHEREGDPRMWFRPSDVTVGTDGAVYVADWFDSVVGGHQLDDQIGTGTIYRITRRGENPQPPEYKEDSVPDLAEMLKSPAKNVRAVGFGGLKKHGADAVPEVAELLTGENEFVVARALFLLAQLGGDGEAEVRKILASESANLRLASVNALRAAGLYSLEDARRLAGDSSPAIRREVALGLRDVPFEEKRDILHELARQYDGEDRWYLEALGTAAEGDELLAYGYLLGRLGAPAAEWSKTFADIAWRLHPKTAVPAFQARAMSAELSVEARRQAIDAIAFIKGQAAADAMGAILNGGPLDLRPYVAYWLKHRASNDWRAFTIESQLTRFPGKPRFSSGVLKKGYVDIEVDIEGADSLYLVADDGGNGNACDWVNWIDPVLMSRDGDAVSMVEMPLAWDENGWGQINANHDATGGPLKVLGREYATGIGGHANMVLAYDLKGKDFTSFKARAAVDDGTPEDGGATFKDSTASVRFLVYHDGPSEAEKAQQRKRLLLRTEAPRADRIEAARELADTAEGGQILLGLAEAEELPAFVGEVVGPLLHNNSSFAVRALAGRFFPLKTLTGKQLPPLAQLATMEGDAARGREVFLSPVANCSQCHTFGDLGRELGPDLSAIGEKFDRPSLLDTILNPSASVLVGYEGHVIETKEGSVLTGLLLADGEVLVIKDLAGERHDIPNEAIAHRRQLPTSLMSEAFGRALEAQELADLVEFLKQGTEEEN